MASIKNIKELEELFLKIFKVTILIIMGLALVAILFFVVTAAYQYSQSPKEPAPAQKAPEKAVSFDDLKKYLKEQKEREDGKEDAPKQQPGSSQQSLRFAEEALSLFRCSGKFGDDVGATVSSGSDKDEELKWLRIWFEENSASPQRGEPWVKDVVTFTCKVLSDPSIIELKKKKEIGKVFGPTREFHLRAWDNIQAEKLRFEKGEAQRVASERASEEVRVNDAKGLAIKRLISAGGAFALFMVLAFYFLGAKIENDLRDINESIRAGGRLEAS